MLLQVSANVCPSRQGCGAGGGGRGGGGGKDGGRLEFSITVKKEQRSQIS